MKTAELTLPELQVWLTQKLGWTPEKILDLLLSVASYNGRRWEQVQESDFLCECEGVMFSKRENGVYRVSICHTDSCKLTEPGEPRLYAVFYSTNQSGIWTPWAYEAIVPFSELHTYVNAERVRYTTHPLPAIDQEEMLVTI